jgi:tetratricopeptide (TPR) repeat protein
VLPYPPGMADKDLKKRLLQTLVASQDRERELEKLSDDVRTDPERWTAKDHVAHLAHWRRHAADVLTAVRTGTPPPHVDDEQAVNARVQAANRARPAEQVKEDARVSYAELGRAIEDCSEEELLKPRPGREKDSVWEVVPGNGHLHLGEHLGFWYEAQGDDRAAEQAQLWTLEVHEAAFSDPKSLSVGRYNLGCYYARHGRTAEALPHIKRSLELNPDLKEWARTDRDLDGVRDDPGLRSILG